MSAVPPRAKTFRCRLALRIAVLCIAILALVEGGIYLGTRQALFLNLDSALLSVARTEAASALDRADGRVHVHDPRRTPPSLARLSQYEECVRIEDAGGRLVVQTQNLDAGAPLVVDPAARALAIQGHVSHGDLRRGTEPYRGVYYPLRDASGRPLVAVVAISQRPVQRVLSLLLGALAVALTLGGGTAALGAFVLAGDLTRPLEKIAGVSRSIGQSSLAVRIPEEYEDAELRDVAAGLNEMLARLEAAFAAERQVAAAQRRFAADASHELRSPLANLRVTVEVALLRRRSAAEYQETLGALLPEIERLGRLVDHLLTLSRSDAGQLALRREPCDLAAIAAAAAQAHRERAQRGSVEITLGGPNEAPAVGDADRLREVVDNLLDNALRHAPPRTTVRLVVCAGDGGVSLSVADAGPGILPEDRERIFDRFYRADASRDRKTGGTGLGLSISRAIVLEHGGQLTVEGEPGSGAVFTLALPAASGTGERRHGATAALAG